MSQSLSGAAIESTSERAITEKHIPFDIQITREVSLDHFLEALGVYLNDLIQRSAGIEWITSDPDIQALRDVYCKAVSLSTVERVRYRSFVELVNTVLFKNQHGPSTIFLRNDPHCLRGARETVAKPGVVFELLCPIIDLDNLEEFKECFRGIFQGHYFLWTSGIHHRDINPTNLMCRRLPDNSIRRVLNDWDLSKLANSNRRSPHSRTGTRPFMAQEILVVNLPIHIERYDWESQLYVLIWIGCRYGRGGVVIDKDVLSEWLKHDFKTLYADKGLIFKDGCPPLTEYYRGLRRWIRPIIRLFRNGHGAIQDDKEARDPDEEKLVMVDISVPFDNLTLGGHVTYSKLREIYCS